MRRATSGDIPLLVSLMKDFYAEAKYDLDQARAAAAFSAVIADEQLGYVWIIDAEGHDVGHIVLTLRFAMEFCGRLACLDDLYVKPAWRNRGLATAALREVADLCKKAGLSALTVEVGADNRPARAVYDRIGFVEAADRRLLTFALTLPAHVK
jgi:GNAT superfamily N-acetyltransferase